MHSSVWIRLLTFLVWLLAAGSAVLWGLKWVRGEAVPAQAAVAAPSAQTSDPRSVAKALGGGPNAANSIANNVISTPAVATNSALNAARFVLTGVVAGKPGVALIAVDGKPPRPYRVGAQVATDAVLHSVAPGKAMLAVDAKSAASLTLELPRQTSALVGTAQPARPPQPALPLAQPAPAVLQQMPAPVAAVQPAHSQGNFNAALEAANGLAGQKALRSSANRAREVTGGSLIEAGAAASVPGQ